MLCFPGQSNLVLVVLLAGSGDGGNEGKERWVWKGAWSKNRLVGILQMASGRRLKPGWDLGKLEVEAYANAAIWDKEGISGKTRQKWGYIYWSREMFI